MPAKGATTLDGEAPTEEPRDVQGAGREGGGTMTGVRVEDVRRAYPSRRGAVAALDGMSLRAEPQRTVAVVGPSGCGKSTLLELICGLQAPDGGTVRVEPAVY